MDTEFFWCDEIVLKLDLDDGYTMSWKYIRKSSVGTMNTHMPTKPNVSADRICHAGCWFMTPVRDKKKTKTDVLAIKSLSD